MALAREARDAVNPEAYLAGGFAPPFSGNLREELENAAAVLADAGVDCLLPEYFGGDTLHSGPIADCVTAVDACASTGLPVFLGVCNVKEDGTMLYGETFADLAKALRRHRVDGIFLMCSLPPAVSACLPRLREAYPGPIGAYAERCRRPGGAAGCGRTGAAPLRSPPGRGAPAARPRPACRGILGHAPSPRQSPTPRSGGACRPRRPPAQPAATRGSSIRTSVPRPASEATAIVPPWSWTRARAT